MSLAAKVNDSEPDPLMGFGLTLVSVAEAIAAAHTVTAGATDALLHRNLSLLNIASAELVQMTARAHALSAHLNQSIARHMARCPRVRS